jgi:hypothetical protein
MTYGAASAAARAHAGRVRVDPWNGQPRHTRHGQLVADWVELFAPVIYEHYRQPTWPQTGSLVLDHLPFRVGTVDEYGFPIPAGDVAFVIFGALGYDAGEPRLWRLES